ncbi:protein-disulfide reductase DsbD domain-containing protein [Pseudomonas mosselii]|uniref:protein-disulfide reductase DsbD domain-containing protein n=1 Tax=Pseudomonas mosselii TaxID=78327 RepID=UPI0021DB1D3A|nr:protein-disulfide reductase DsbD domain-containing protein [Pseudomonas mosselii]MCU9528347.1 protein-disulfide reductase DsbD family protein [Pseudomonas mosselii]MCU9535520.1 protein-disulfide reductase DsbD family protein [Pseudomonas mosselii]MCU9543420.1 protein-disulfide reductase DsbD family protein [Pseudomonas mosselii]MCU9547371.1 protein-disulfide reductase DsbD family protein [Pseudomonas mosselii]
MTRRFFQAIIALTALLTLPLAAGENFSTTPSFLPVHEAFKVSAIGTPDAIQVYLVAAPGYYLYKSKLSFSVAGRGVTAGNALLPAGELKTDPYFGDVLVYHGALTARVPVENHGAGGFTLRVGFQGCAEKGLCYPPDFKEIQIPSGAGSAASAEWSWWRVVLALASGLGLVITPWALAAAPILNFVLLRNGMSFRRRVCRGLTFAASFLAGYSIINAAIAWFSPGLYIQGALQSPPVLIPCSAILLVLGSIMAMRNSGPVPDTLIRSFRGLSRLILTASSVALGVLATIAVTPYVPESLANSMLYLRAGGDIVGGVIEIMAFALGMVGPVIVMVVGVSQLVSRPRAWMPGARQVNAVLLGIVAIWIAGRVLPGQLTLGIYGVLAVGVAISLGAFTPRAKSHVTIVLAGLTLAYGVTAWLGMLKGEADPINPLGISKGEELTWSVVSTPDRLAAAIAESKTAGTPVLVEWYADWAASSGLSHLVAASPKIRSAVREIKLIRVDLTRGGLPVRRLLELNGLMGPGALQFIRPDGIESADLRLVGVATEIQILSSIERLVGYAEK